MRLGGNGNMSQTEGAIATAGLSDHIDTRTEKLRTAYSLRHGQIAGPQPGTLGSFAKQMGKISTFLITAVLPSLFLAATASASSVITPGVGDPGRNPSNPFDYSNITITSNSATYNAGSNIQDIFGGSFSTLEAPGRTIFSDMPGAVTTYQVSFTTNAPVALGGFSLVLSEDGGSLNRSATNFELTANGNVISNVALASVGQSYAMKFGSDSIEVSDSFSPVTATSFQAIFTSNSGYFNGIRVLQFTGQGASSSLDPAAEPSTISLALLAGLVFAAFFRRRIERKT